MNCRLIINMVQRDCPGIKSSSEMLIITNVIFECIIDNLVLSHYYSNIIDKIHLITLYKMLLIKDGQEITINLQDKLKPGCTKVAYKISEDQVLILPNRPNEDWNEIVLNEVSSSKFLTSIGLLNPYHEPVYIPSLKINSYMSKSFESFSNEGIKVMDVKRPDYTAILDIDAD